MLAELLSDAALHDAFLKGLLHELLSTAQRPESQFEKPMATVTGASPALCSVFDSIRRYAISRAPVFITGESGAARELAARAIHYGSASRYAPFITTSCAP